MKIAVLLGSPRSKGNSAAIAARFTETAAKGGAEIRTFELNRLSYSGCQGCYACKKGSETCVVKDDLAEVLAAVQDADAVVLASPVYFGEVTSQLKGFIDRCYSYLKPDYITSTRPSRLSPKKLIFILTQGHPDAAMFEDIFPRYEKFLTWLGFTDCRLIRVCGVGPGREDRVAEEYLQQAGKEARALVS